MAASDVQFLVSDIIHPRPAEVLSQLYGNNCLRGEVIATTDDGHESQLFLVVRVPNLGEPVIVPVEAARSSPHPYQPA
jgi:hypothetical protein